MADVIIIGSGMAGAAAAFRLSKSGIRSLVIEAQDRLGGKAFKLLIRRAAFRLAR